MVMSDRSASRWSKPQAACAAFLMPAQHAAELPPHPPGQTLHIANINVEICIAACLSTAAADAQVWSLAHKQAPVQELDLTSALSLDPSSTDGGRPFAVSAAHGLAAVAHAHQVFSTAFQPRASNQPVATSSQKGTLRQPIDVKLVASHDGSVTCLAWHPNALAVASACADGSLWVTML